MAVFSFVTGAIPHRYAIQTLLIVVKTATIGEC